MSGTSLAPVREPLPVAHVLAPAGFGGLESVVRALAIGRHRRGSPVRVLCVVGPGPIELPLAAALRGAGVETMVVTLPRRAYRRERSAVAEFLRRSPPALVHTHGYRSDVVSAGVARDLGIPTISTVHGFIGGGWKERFYERLQLRLLRRFDAVVAVSRPIQRRILAAGVPADRVHLIRNAWDGSAAARSAEDVRRVLAVGPDRLHVGWVGRLDREKGPDVALEAVALLDDLPWTLSFIGDGPQRGSLARRAQQLGLGDRVRFHGQLDGAAELFSGFDLFLLSSRTEGTPMVLFEAMAAGVPIVATAVGGVPDVIGPSDGILVPAEDPVGLAGAIRMVWGDRSAAAGRAAAASRRLGSEFRLDTWLDHYERVYQTVTGLRPR